MSIQKLKTVFSTGAWLNKVKTFYDKINEIIDYLNGTGPSGSGSYKKYEALLSQQALQDPTVSSLLNNNTGQTLTWVYTDVGQYTAVGDFPDITKCALIPGTSPGASHIASLFTTSSVTIFTFDTAGLAANEVLSNTFIEIRIYN